MWNTVTSRHSAYSLYEMSIQFILLRVHPDSRWLLADVQMQQTYHLNWQFTVTWKPCFFLHLHSHTDIKRFNIHGWLAYLAYYSIKSCMLLSSNCAAYLCLSLVQIRHLAHTHTHIHFHTLTHRSFKKLYKIYDNKIINIILDLLYLYCQNEMTLVSWATLAKLVYWQPFAKRTQPMAVVSLSLWYITCQKKVSVFSSKSKTKNIK